MALLTPSALVQVWAVTSTTSEWFDFEAGVILGDGGVLVCGMSLASGMGCNLVQFDPDTGEPLDFAENQLASGDGDWLGVWHFPADSAVVLFARDNVGTGGTTIYGQRVEYDIATCTLTPGPVTTWLPNNGTNNLTSFAADVPDSSTINVLGWGASQFGTSTLDLSAGTNSGRTDHTIASMGIGTDRVDLIGVAGVHGAGVIAVNSYLNASGFATGVPYIVTFNGGPPAMSAEGGARLTSWGNSYPISTTASMVLALTRAGGPSDSQLTASGFTTLPTTEVHTDATIQDFEIRPTYADTGGGDTISFNREGATFGSGNDLVPRWYDPFTGAELAAWTYPPNWDDVTGSFGMLTANGQFWWATFGNQFRVYEGPPYTPSSWHVGYVGSRS